MAIRISGTTGIDMGNTPVSNVDVGVLDYNAVNKQYVDTKVNDVIGQLSTDSYQGPYGISWDYATDTYIRTGAKGYTAIQSMMKRCVLNADGTVNYYLNPDNSNFKEDGTPAVLTGADGNVMVEIPAFYSKIETVGTVDKFSISLTAEPGYTRHPAFFKNAVEVPYRYYSAYEGFNQGGVLRSISGVTPTRSQNFPTFRNQAKANGIGWYMIDYHLLNAIKLLVSIEFADFKTHLYIGNGNYTGDDYGRTTGVSNALGNKSTPPNSDALNYMSYRGIEDWYANDWIMIDGINIRNYEVFISNNHQNFASDVFTGDYVSTGISVPAGANQSYIKRQNVSTEYGFIPSIIGGSSTTYYSDGLWSATGNMVFYHGGNANTGSLDGSFSIHVNYPSTYSHAAIASGLSF